MTAQEIADARRRLYNDPDLMVVVASAAFGVLRRESPSVRREDVEIAAQIATLTVMQRHTYTRCGIQTYTGSEDRDYIVGLT